MRAALWMPLPHPRPDWALFLDLDGTLLDLAAAPDAVVVPANLCRTLVRASAVLGGALAIVSGRRLDDVDRLLAPLRLCIAAEHGAVIRRPDGDYDDGAALPAVPANWRAVLHAFAAVDPGILVEEKPHGIAGHFRRAPHRGPELHQLMAGLAAERPTQFVLTPARFAWELRPCHVDKGGAVERLLAMPPFVGRVPVFVGDDVTDEDGIRAVERHGGLGLHVERDFGGEPARVRAWLQQLPRRIAAVARD